MLPCKLNNSCPFFNLFDLDYNNLLRALELGVFFFFFGGEKSSAQHNSHDLGSLPFPSAALWFPTLLPTEDSGQRAPALSWAWHASSFPFLVASLEEDLICSFHHMLPCPCRAFLECLKRNPSAVTCRSPVWWFE